MCSGVHTGDMLTLLTDLRHHFYHSDPKLCDIMDARIRKVTELLGRTGKEFGCMLVLATPLRAFALTPQWPSSSFFAFNSASSSEKTKSSGLQFE
jgi:hypothetical protein